MGTHAPDDAFCPAELGSINLASPALAPQKVPVKSGSWFKFINVKYKQCSRSEVAAGAQSGESQGHDGKFPSRNIEITAKDGRDQGRRTGKHRRGRKILTFSRRFTTYGASEYPVPSQRSLFTNTWVVDAHLESSHSLIERGITPPER